MAEFYSARGWEIPPLPWTNLSPPFSEDLRTELKRLHDKLLEDYDEMNSRVLNKVEEARQLLSEEDEIDPCLSA